MKVVLCGRSCRVLRAVYPNSIINQAFAGGAWRKQPYGGTDGAGNQGFRIIGGPLRTRALAIAMLLIYAAAHHPRYSQGQQHRRDCYKAREEAERICHDLGA